MTSEEPVPAPSRVAGVLARLANRKPTRSPRTDRLILAAALVLFVGVAVYAVSSLDGVPLADDWPIWIAVAASLAIVNFVVNAAEFAVSASLLGKRAPLAEAARVSILGSAANVLPIPGAAMVRAAALRRMDLGYRPALSITAVIGLVWVGTGCLTSAWLLLVAGNTAVGLTLLLAGGAAVAAGVGLLSVELSWRAALRGLPLVLVVEAGSVAVGVVRMWAILRALGADASLADASALIAVSIVASAAGLLPGGLGLREALSAAISVAIGIAAELGVLGAVVDRVVGYAMLALATVVVLAVSKAQAIDDPQPVESAGNGETAAGRAGRT